jgi:hypothetical protein
MGGASVTLSGVLGESALNIIADGNGFYSFLLPELVYPDANSTLTASASGYHTSKPEFLTPTQPRYEWIQNIWLTPLGLGNFVPKPIPGHPAPGGGIGRAMPGPCRRPGPALPPS